MRRQLQQTFTLALLLAVIPLHAAEIYKYQDANGKWRFTDKKPKEPTAETLTLKSAEKQKKV